MLENILEIRNKFPITKNGHYLCSASIAGMHVEVIKAHHNWIDFTANEGGMNDQRYFEVLESARDAASGYIGCYKNEVAFVSNSSYAFNIMAMMLAQSTTKRKILIPEQEFPTSFLPWHYQGFEVIPIKANQNKLEVADFLNSLDEQTAAVVCSGINSFTGQRLPVVKLGEALRDRQIPFFVNQTQQAGVFELDWKKAHITGLCFSCHKRFAACMGTSVFALNKTFFEKLKWPLIGWTSVEEPWEMKNLGTKPRMDLSAIELGSMPFNNLLAINTSINIQQSIGINKISSHILELTRYLIENLKKLPIKILSPHSSESDLSGIVSFIPGDLNVENLVKSLAKEHIYVNQRKTFIRASLFLYNTKEDIDALIQSLNRHMKH